jgi:hypothetical protein
LSRHVCLNDGLVIYRAGALALVVSSDQQEKPDMELINARDELQLFSKLVVGQKTQQRQKLIY